MASDMRQAGGMLEALRRLHGMIRDAVVDRCEAAGVEEMAQVAAEEAEDTIYAVDRVSEEVLVDFFQREVAPQVPVVLIAEGIAQGKVVLPAGCDEAEAVWRVIVDPIDGTRGLMYQKRSAWILTGVAPNKGPATGLQHIELAVQTEIPLVKQHLSDVAWAVRGQGARAERWDRLKGQATPLALRPSTAAGLEHGFASVAKFFPGDRGLLGEVDDAFMQRALGPPAAGKVQCFEDQYISAGGQLYELMAGRDRFVADLRPLLQRLKRRSGETPVLCSHPYDLCTALIAQEAGVVVTDERGGDLLAPLSVDADVGMVGYANEGLRRRLQPLLLEVLAEKGLL